MMNAGGIKTFKVILAGNHQAGKTLFLQKWRDPQFSGVTQPTVGIDLACQTVTVQGTQYKIQLWDTAGQEAYHSITAPYFRSCKGVFLVFDVTSSSSFGSLDYWINMIKENSNQDPLIVVIANKSDLPNHQVSKELIADYCRRRELPFFLTSALSGENIENAANFMVHGLIEHGDRARSDSMTIDIQERERKIPCKC